MAGSVNAAIVPCLPAVRYSDGCETDWYKCESAAMVSASTGHTAAR